METCVRLVNQRKDYSLGLFQSGRARRKCASLADGRQELVNQYTRQAQGVMPDDPMFLQ